MAYLSQASATVANSPKITISIWCQRLTSDAKITLMEWGNRYSDSIVDPYSGSEKLRNKIVIQNDVLP